MGSTTKHKQESHGLLRRYRAVGYIVFAVLAVSLFLVICVCFLRSAAQEKIAEQQANKDKEWISNIKQGSTTQPWINSSRLLKKLSEDPVCREKIDGVSITFSYLDSTFPDESIKLLRCFPNLNFIHVCEANDADVVFKNIQKMKSVEKVSLDLTPISSEGMRYIATLPNLKKLTLKEYQLNKMHIAALRSHPALENLRLVGNITEDGLVILNEIPKLRSVSIDAIKPISPVFFKNLKKLTSLKELHLSGSGLDAKEIADLQQALPNCKVKVESREN